MAEQSIIIGDHRLSIVDDTALFLNGHFVSIQEVSQEGIVLMSQTGQKYQVSGQDFYRLIAGGVEPNPKTVGELYAQCLMHKAQQSVQEPVKPRAKQKSVEYKIKPERLVKG